MTVFLCDGECEYSYDDLLRHLNQDNYFPLLKTHHLFSYFGNLVKALTNDVPLVLLDSDLSPAELDGVDESLVNQSKKNRKNEAIAIHGRSDRSASTFNF